MLSIFFSSTHPSTTEIYTLSLHDALPICGGIHSTKLAHSGGKAIRVAIFLSADKRPIETHGPFFVLLILILILIDRKSTRLNSSHQIISYAVFCLKIKNTERVG